MIIYRHTRILHDATLRGRMVKATWHEFDLGRHALLRPLFFTLSILLVQKNYLALSSPLVMYT